MAQNDLNPNFLSSEDDEDASGTDDEQTSGTESEDASDSPSEENQQTLDPQKTLISPPLSAIKPQAPHISSESEESGSDSGTDSDSDSPPKLSAVADPNIKPIRSIPMERQGSNVESELAKNSGSKSSSTPPPVRSKRPASLPPAGADEKFTKKAKSNTEDDSKKQLFQRLWSEDDEIVILKGIIDYKAENGENPITDMGAFYEFIKKSLHVDVSRAQLVDKIRRLKKKYVNNASRSEKDGKDRSFSKSHEQKGYELSKLIWGSASGGHNSGTESKKKQSQKNGNVAGASTSVATGNAATLAKSNGLDDKEVSVMEVEKNMDISRFVRYGGRDESPVLPEEIVKAGIELVEGSKRVELEERWKSLKKKELELYLMKMDLVKEQALIVLEAVNSSGN